MKKSAQGEKSHTEIPRVLMACKFPLFVAVASAMLGAFAALPEGALRANYITSANCYVDTRYVPKSKTRVVMNFRFESLPSGTAAYSGVQETDGHQFLMGVNKTGNFTSAVTSSLVAAIEAGVADREQHEFDISSGSQKIDGEEYGTQTIDDGAKSPLYLLAMNNRWAGGAGYYQSIRIYGCKIYEDGALVRDFIPCYHDNQARLWDDANGEWYDKKGTGSFTAFLDGGYPLPQGAVRIGSIKSDGCHVDTKYVPCSKTRVVMDCQMVGELCKASYSGLQSASGHQFYMGVGSDGKFASAVSSTSVSSCKADFADMERHVFDVASGSQKFDGREYGTQTINDSGTDRFYLFALYNVSTKKYVYQAIRFFGCRIYEDGELVRNFIPCVYNNQVRLWEAMNGEWYDKSGEGTFEAVGECLPDTLTVECSVPGLTGAFEPANLIYDLAAGQRVRIAAADKVTRAADGVEYACCGWKLYNQDGLLVDQATLRRFAYTHNRPGEALNLVWQWARYDPPVVAGVPVEYQPLEYVGANGTQYIDTEIEPDTTTRLLIDFSIPNPIDSSTTYLSGWGNGGVGGKDAFFFGARQSEFQSSVSGEWEIKSTGSAVDTGRHLFDLQSGSQKFDTQEYATDELVLGKVSAGARRHIYLLATSTGWAPYTVSYAMDARIYSCQIYTNGVIALDLRPVRKLNCTDFSDACGLYDIIGKKYFTAKDTKTSQPVELSWAGPAVVGKLLKDKKGLLFFIK